MGSEAATTIRFDNKKSKGRAYLETNELIFRGDFRLVISFASISSVGADNGCLEVTFDGGHAELDLGDAASKWAAKIRSPRSRLDKLGVKPGQTVAVIGVEDTHLIEELEARAQHVSVGRARKDTDIIFFAVDALRDLERLAKLQRSLKPNGAIWVVRVKGSSASVKESDVFASAKQNGLVDVKVVAFSETHSALKLVIPVARR